MAFKLNISDLGDDGKKYTVTNTKRPINIWFLSFLLPMLLIPSLQYIIGIICIVLILYCSCQMHEECITVLPSLGIEFEHIWLCGYRQKEFVVWNDIDTIIMNEGFRMLQVHYYFAILPIHQRELYLPFKSFILSYQN